MDQRRVVGEAFLLHGAVGTPVARCRRPGHRRGRAPRRDRPPRVPAQQAPHRRTGPGATRHGDFLPCGVRERLAEADLGERLAALAAESLDPADGPLGRHRSVCRTTTGGRLFCCTIWSSATGHWRSWTGSSAAATGPGGSRTPALRRLRHHCSSAPTLTHSARPRSTRSASGTGRSGWRARRTSVRSRPAPPRRAEYGRGTDRLLSRRGPHQRRTPVLPGRTHYTVHRSHGRGSRPAAPSQHRPLPPGHHPGRQSSCPDRQRTR